MKNCVTVAVLVWFFQYILQVFAVYCWFACDVMAAKQKHFLPLGTTCKHHFHVNYTINVYCIDHQHGRL